MEFWLHNANLTNSMSPLNERVQQARKKVKELETQLDEEFAKERLDSILNRIGAKMTAWSDKLQLEHSGNPVRYDNENITVVVDSEDNPIPLSKMGSGENWLGYHLIASLALQDYFVTHARPVPRFLFLDQPSQVYYPPELDEELRGSLEGLSSEDRKAVHRIFDFIFDAAADLEPNLQVIVTDHADLDDRRFKGHIVERWRNKKALVPLEWGANNNPNS